MSSRLDEQRLQFSLARLLAAVTCAALALAAWKVPPLERVTGDEPHTGLVTLNLGAIWALFLGLFALSLVLEWPRANPITAVIASAFAIFFVEIEIRAVDQWTAASRAALSSYALFANLFVLLLCSGIAMILLDPRRKPGPLTFLLSAGGVIGITASYALVWWSRF